MRQSVPELGLILPEYELYKTFATTKTNSNCGTIPSGTKGFAGLKSCSIKTILF